MIIISFSWFVISAKLLIKKINHIVKRIHIVFDFIKKRKKSFKNGAIHAAAIWMMDHLVSENEELGTTNSEWSPVESII